MICIKIFRGFHALHHFGHHPLRGVPLEVWSLSKNTDDPSRAYRAMADSYMLHRDLSLSTHRRNILENLRRTKTGTNEIESLAKRVTTPNPQTETQRNPRIVNYILKERIVSLKKLIKTLRKKARKVTEALPSHVLIDNSNNCLKKEIILRQFHHIRKTELNAQWTENQRRRRRKINNLKRKHHPKPPGTYKDIEFDDESLGRIPNPPEEPIVYGQGLKEKITPQMAAALTLPHKFKMYGPIDVRGFENRLEKTLTQIRWELMKNEREEGERVSDEEQISEKIARTIYDHENRSLNFTKLRPTDMKTCPRSFVPEPKDNKEEEKLQIIRSSLMNVAEEYIAKETLKGKPKTMNAGKDVMKGVKEIKRLIDNKEAIVTITDKSGRMTIDTPENYNIAMKRHLKEDPIITHKEKDRLEKQCSITAGHMVKVFNISRDTDQSRTKQAMTSSHTPAPPGIPIEEGSQK